MRTDDKSISTPLLQEDHLFSTNCNLSLFSLSFEASCLRESNIAELIHSRFKDETRLVASIEELEYLYTALSDLSQNDCESERNAIRKCQLSIMKSIDDGISQLMMVNIEHILLLHNFQESPEISFLGKIKQYLSVVLFFFVIVTQLAINALYTFLGASELMKAIFPDVSKLANAVASAFIVLFELILFCSFEAAFLKEFFGANNLDKADLYLQYDHEELELTKNINMKINRLIKGAYNQQPIVDYSTMFPIINLFNLNMANVQLRYQGEYQEPDTLRAIRIGVTIIGSMLTVVGSYYSMTALLTMLHKTSLIGTSTGNLIIIIGTISSLASFMSMRGKGMVNMLNPGMKKFNLMKEKTNDFIPVTKDELISEYHQACRYRTLSQELNNALIEIDRYRKREFNIKQCDSEDIENGLSNLSMFSKQTKVSRIKEDNLLIPFNG